MLGKSYGRGIDEKISSSTTNQPPVESFSSGTAPVAYPGRGQFRSFPQYARLDYKGQVAILINDGNGWVIETAQGRFINPWTQKPFQQLCHAKNAIKARFKFGRWPGIKKAKPL